MNAVVNTISSAVIYPIITLLFAAGLIVFIWGVIEFLMGLSQIPGGSKADDGKRHMLWGLVGMFIMVAAVTLVQMIKNTFPPFQP